jgi:hypothetical protein
MLIIKEEHFDKLMQVRALKQSQTSNTALLDMCTVHRLLQDQSN